MSNDMRTVLLIEDDDGHARLAVRALQSGQYRLEVERVACLADAAQRMSERRYDALVCDLSLPDSHGLETVSAIRKQQPDTPLVVLTSLADEQTALAALDKGAQDYLSKDSLGTGERSLERALRYAMQRQAASREIKRLFRQSRHHERLLKNQNVRLAQLYKIAQQVVENVSHEFRTPLTVIKEYVALIRDGLLGTITAEQGNFLDVIGDRAEDLNRMVDDMLDVSKVDAGLLTVRRVECEITSVVRHVILNLKRKAALKGMTLTLDVAERLPRVFCDPDKVGRTIINLVVNAIKFSHDAGEVRLSIRASDDRKEVVIAVADNGPGISEADLQKLFARFAQVDKRLRETSHGFGLGLSIAKELVEMNLGQISVRSEVSRGSCFSFTVPCAEPVEIATRYLARLSAGAERTAVATVALVRAEPATVDGTDDVEPLLYYVLSANDLIYRVGPRAWLVLIACDADGFGKFRRRLDKSLRETNRNRLGQPLPALNSELLGSWSVHEHQPTILAEVRAVTLHADEVFV